MTLLADELEVVLLSLRVSFVAVTANVPFAIAMAYLLARHDFAGKSVLDAVVHLPLVLPPVVVGYLLLLGFGRRGIVGGFLEQHLGITVAFRWTGAALAAALMGFPLMVRAIRQAFEAIDLGLEAAARTLGAGPVRLFVTVSLPLAVPGILTGALLGFARALGEFGATITFVSSIPGETRTLPLAIYAYTQVPGGDAMAMRLSLLAVVLSLIALIASEWSVQRFARRMRGGDAER